MWQWMQDWMRDHARDWRFWAGRGHGPSPNGTTYGNGYANGGTGWSSAGHYAGSSGWGCMGGHGCGYGSHQGYGGHYGDRWDDCW